MTRSSGEINHGDHINHVINHVANCAINQGVKSFNTVCEHIYTYVVVGQHLKSRDAFFRYETVDINPHGTKARKP